MESRFVLRTRGPLPADEANVTRSSPNRKAAPKKGNAQPPSTDGLPNEQSPLPS